MSIHERLGRIFGGIGRCVGFVQWLTGYLVDTYIFPYLHESIVLSVRKTIERGEKTLVVRKSYSTPVRRLPAAFAENEQLRQDLLFHLERLLVTFIITVTRSPTPTIPPLRVKVEEGHYGVATVRDVTKHVISVEAVVEVADNIDLNQLETLVYTALDEQEENINALVAHEIYHLLDSAFEITSTFPPFSSLVEVEGKRDIRSLLRGFTVRLFLTILALLHRWKGKRAEEFAYGMGDLTNLIDRYVPPSERMEVIQQLRAVVDIVRTEGKEGLSRNSRQFISSFLWDIVTAFKGLLEAWKVEGDTLKRAKEEVADLFRLSVDDLDLLLSLGEN